MLPGHTLDDYAAGRRPVGADVRRSVCRVRSVPRQPHELELWLLIDDPLPRVVPPFDRRPGSPRESGLRPPGRGRRHWRLRPVGSHVLVVGATGAGKGSVLWSILFALAEPIRAGLVKVWAIDPKGGMELASGRHLFDRFCHGDNTTVQPPTRPASRTSSTTPCR